MRACEILNTEATRLYLELTDDHTSQLQILSEKTSEFHRASHRAALLAANEMGATIHALVAHCDKVAVNARACPKLSLDQWKQMTTTDVGTIVTQFMHGARNDLAVHSQRRIVDHWRKLVDRLKMKPSDDDHGDLQKTG
jgi:hypothetical protein